MTFDDVIGQDDVRQRLLQMEHEGRLPHALMLVGEQGWGGLPLAVAFACHLLTPGGDGGDDDDDPDNFMSAPNPARTAALAMLRKLEHPDLHFTFPTIKLPAMGGDHVPVSDDFIRQWRETMLATPYFSIDEWLAAMGAENQQAIITARESDELVRKLSLKSSQGGYKVSIIWLPERMNIASANKLLKLIEEPPRQTVFLMVAEDPGQLLETIRSRVQRIDLKRLPDSVVEQALVSRQALDPEQARRTARLAGGSWLKALGELQTGTENEAFLDLFILLMRLAYTRKVKDLKKWSETIAAMGREKQRRFLAYFLRQTRENFMYNFRQPELCYMTQAEEDFARNFARFVNENNILSVTALAERAMRDVGQNANPKILFFHFALQMIMLLKAD